MDTSRKIAWSLAAGVATTAIGIIGLWSDSRFLLYLLYPGMYPFADKAEGLGILIFLIGLPLNMILYSVISFAVLSLTLRRKSQEDD
jgi:hypothetical protein